MSFIQCEQRSVKELITLYEHASVIIAFSAEGFIVAEVLIAIQKALIVVWTVPIKLLHMYTLNGKDRICN